MSPAEKSEHAFLKRLLGESRTGFKENFPHLYEKYVAKCAFESVDPFEGLQVVFDSFEKHKGNDFFGNFENELDRYFQEKYDSFEVFDPKSSRAGTEQVPFLKNIAQFDYYRDRLDALSKPLGKMGIPVIGYMNLCGSRWNTGAVALVRTYLDRAFLDYMARFGSALGFMDKKSEKGKRYTLEEVGEIYDNVISRGESYVFNVLGKKSIAEGMTEEWKHSGEYPDLGKTFDSRNE